MTLIARYRRNGNRIELGVLGPYRCEEAETTTAGAVAGQEYCTGAIVGQDFHAGADAGQTI